MKLHQDESYLRREIDGGKNSRDIAKELGVSWKLIEIYLRRFNIKHTSYKREE